MKPIFILIIAFFIGQISYAQTITGQVMSQSGEAFAYANVVAKEKETSKFVKGALTDETGKFQLELQTIENIQLEISYVGYKTKIISDLNADLGKIQLDVDNELEEVVVIAQKQTVEQKADRLIFNVENSPTVSGGDAIDALKVTPGVSVMNNEISILGKGTVNVLINDKLVQMQGDELLAYLESISADDIQKIEVITTPPAKYDAEGNSGLINIQLKQPKEGSWNNSVRAGFIQTTYPAVTYGNTFTYNNGKLSTVVSIHGKDGYRGEFLSTDVAYPTGPWIGETDFKSDQNNFTSRIGVDYQFGKNTTIGGLFSYSTGNKFDSDNGFNDVLNTQNQQIGKVISKGEAVMKPKNQSANIHWLQKIDTLGRKLSIDADYFHYDRPQNRIFSSEQIDYNPSMLKVNNLSGQDIENKSIKFDMEHPFQKVQLSYGAKYSKTSTESFVQYWNTTSGERVLDTNQSNEFDYQENVAATYADASKQFSKRWQAKAGLRVEHTETKGVSKTVNQTNENKYTKLFPTLYLAHTINEKNQANLSYSKRIRRPGFWALNPFRWYINQNSYAEGNPFLQPELSDNIELQHVYKGALISKIFYSKTNQSYGEVSTVNASENQIFVSRQNFYDGTKYGLQETLVFSPAKQWNTTTQLAVYNTEGSLRKGFSNIKLNTGWAYSIYSSNSIAITDKNSLKAEITGFLASPQPIYMFKTGYVGSLNLGLSAKFLNDKLTVNASANDLFQTSDPTVFATSNGIAQKFRNYQDSRNTKLNIKYSFGNQKIRVKQRKFGNADEQGRTGN